MLMRELTDDGLHPNDAGYELIAPLAENANRGRACAFARQESHRGSTARRYRTWSRAPPVRSSGAGWLHPGMTPRNRTAILECSESSRLARIRVDTTLVRVRRSARRLTRRTRRLQSYAAALEWFRFRRGESQMSQWSDPERRWPK
jgi:hypothetical protein